MSIEGSVVKKLSERVNVANGLTHPSDESAAKELIKEMVKRGHSFNTGEVYSKAINHGWPHQHAKKLSELAEKISQGQRVVIKQKNQWNPKVFDEVESDA